MAQKFSTAEVAGIRSLIHSTDANPWNTAEVLQMFLADRGYGSSPEITFHAAAHIVRRGCSLESVQSALEELALVC